MPTASMLTHSATVAALCAALAAAPAIAQTSPDQGTNGPPSQTVATTAAAPAAPAYVPTSLEPDDPYSIPHTPDGHPDFQGVVWHANFFAFLQNPSIPTLTLPEDRAKPAFERMTANMANAPGLELDPEAAHLIKAIDGLPLVRGERRTRLLVLPANGRMPFTDEARKEIARPIPRTEKFDNPEERDLMERCIVAVGEPPPSAALAPIPNARQFIQTKDHIVIHTEYFDEARIIPFATERQPNALQSRLGNSIARWEGNTLVIETTGLPDYQRRRGLPAFIVNADATVIERYTRVSANELLYQWTVVDPKVYSAPWLAEYSFYRAPFRMFPSGCHEANYSLPNILRGQRVADAKAATPNRSSTDAAAVD
jgi:hypothetical protein